MGKGIEKGRSLADVFPELAKEWNYEKNDGKKPSDYYAKSGKKVWWRSSQGHFS